MSDKKSPFDSLTEEQRLRLANLTSEIEFDKITASFLIEARENFTKKAAFYSATIARKSEEDAGWGLSDVRVVRALLSKHVVTACYDDAVKRRMLTSAQAHEECSAILAAYDAQIVKNLSNKSE